MGDRHLHPRLYHSCRSGPSERGETVLERSILNSSPNIESFPNNRIRRKDLLFPEESYQIVGILFDVYNAIGAGHHERYYQRAIAQALRERKIPYREQVFSPLKYRGATIGRQYFDFLLWDKIILEIKKGAHFSKRHVDQVVEYLEVSGRKLAILANFGERGITFRRLVRLGDSYIRT